MTAPIPDWLAGATGALIVSAAARALPDPEPMGSKLYLWLYRFAHFILANFDKSASDANYTPPK